MYAGGTRSPRSTCDDARVPIVTPRRTFAVAISAIVALLAASACRTTTERACGPVTRERLDSTYLVHVLEDGADVAYTTDPPTSGPHKPGPEISGVLTEPLARPLQVGALERGDILLQHSPDLPSDQRSRLGALAGPGVVVAPNPDLPSAVVATAWTYKLRCTSVDVAALRRFIDQRAGKGPDG